MKKTTFKLSFTAALALAYALTSFGCNNGGGGGGNCFGSDCGGGGDGGIGIVVYEEVVIGSQVWMKKNLNIYADGSKCYNNNADNCDKYGRLYSWATAMALPNNCNNNDCSSQVRTKHQGICPNGWYIPSKDDWKILSDFVENFGGCYDCDGKILKASSGWAENGNGQDTHGFAALPAGTAFSGGDFISAGYTTSWWSSTENSAGNIYHQSMNYDLDSTSGNFEAKTYYLRSVRCIKN